MVILLFQFGIIQFHEIKNCHYKIGFMVGFGQLQADVPISGMSEANVLNRNVGQVSCIECIFTCNRLIGSIPSLEFKEALSVKLCWKRVGLWFNSTGVLVKR